MRSPSLRWAMAVFTVILGFVPLADSPAQTPSLTEGQIPKIAVLATVMEGLKLPVQQAKQLSEPTPSLGLRGSQGLVPRRDSAARNIQYLPLVQSTAPRGLAPSELDAGLRRYLREHSDDFKLDPATLTPADRPRLELGGKVILSYHQRVAAARVEMALVQATFFKDPDGSFRLVDIVNQTYGELDEHALASAFSALGEEPLFQEMAILARENVITPVFENGAYSYKPGRRYLIEDQKTAQQYRVSVGSDGKMRHGISQLQAFQGEVTATVFDRGYFNGIKTDLTLKHALVGDTFTSSSGFVSLPDGDYQLQLFSGFGSNTRTVNTPDRRINIIDYQGTETPRGFSAPISLRGNRARLSNLSELEMTAVNAFVAVNRVWDFALLYLDGATDTDGIVGNEVAFLTQGIDVRVNQPVIAANTRCNAFFNPNSNSLNFFVANQPCGNFAQLNDVIYHEWGHALDNAVGPSKGITDGAFSEGLSDVVSGYFTGDPRVAPGFTTNNITGGLRNLQNSARLSDGNLRGVHAQGTVIGGAFWDLRQSLEARYGASGIALAEKLFFQHLLITDQMVQSYTSVLRLDDDDGDLTNGTPNICLINAAFARHELTSPRGCQDQPTGLRVQVLDEDINGALMLELSLPDDGTIPAICLDSEGSCASSLRQDIAARTIKNPLARASGRRVFRTRAGVPVNGKAALSFSVLVLKGDGSVATIERITMQSR